MGGEGGNLLPARPPGGSTLRCIPQDRRQHLGGTDKLLHPRGSYTWMGLFLQAFNSIQQCTMCTPYNTLLYKGLS